MENQFESFEKFKEFILEAARAGDACASEYRKAYAAENYDQMLDVIKQNAEWCYKRNVFNIEIAQRVPDEDLTRNLIYVKKDAVIQREGFAIYYGSTSEHYGSSTSKHYDSSTSEHYDSSTSKHYDSSTSKHYGSSTSKHYGSSTSKHYGSSTSEHYGSSTSEHYGSSTSKHYDSSTSEHYGYTYFVAGEDCHKIEEKAVRRDFEGNLYFKKDAFTINIIE